MEANDNTEYDAWNELKKKIHQLDTKAPDYFPQGGEVWVSSLGKNIGFEQNGSGTLLRR